MNVSMSVCSNLTKRKKWNFNSMKAERKIKIFQECKVLRWVELLCYFRFFFSSTKRKRKIFLLAIIIIIMPYTVTFLLSQLIEKRVSHFIIIFNDFAKPTHTENDFVCCFLCESLIFRRKKNCNVYIQTSFSISFWMIISFRHENILLLCLDIWIFYAEYERLMCQKKRNEAREKNFLKIFCHFSLLNLQHFSCNDIYENLNSTL